MHVDPFLSLDYKRQIETNREWRTIEKRGIQLWKMEIQQLEAARIIIGSMDLTGKKRTMKNREVLLFRETLGF